MTDRLPSIRDVDARQVALVAVCIVAVALTMVAQLLWIITFDETGLDRVAPDPAFTVLLPAASLATIPTAAAYSLYGRRGAAAAGGVVLVGSAALASYTVTFFGLCGRPC